MLTIEQNLNSTVTTQKTTIDVKTFSERAKIGNGRAKNLST
jgi:hypothetical protein